MNDKQNRQCPNCGAHYAIWAYGILYAPRTLPTAGWIKRQCPKCFSVGGLDEEALLMKERERELLETIHIAKDELGELRKIMKALDKGTIMEESDDN